MVSVDKRVAGRPRDETLVARRREEILPEASLFFAEFGYRNADVQVLAERLKVGKGTVYRYFETKEALFFASVDAGIRRLIEAIDIAVEGIEDPVVHITKAVHAYLGFFERNPHIVELLIIERAEFRDREQATYFQYKERQHEYRLEVFKQAIAQGTIRPMDPDRVMRLFSDTLYGVIFTNNFSRRQVPSEKQAEEILDIFFNGILRETGQA